MSKEPPSYKAMRVLEELSKYHAIEDMRIHVKEIASKFDVTPRYVNQLIRGLEQQREKVAEALSKLFIVRSDDFMAQLENKTSPRQGKALTPDLVKDHLEGKITLVPYSLNKESMGRYIGFDIDPKIGNVEEVTRLIYQTCLDGFKEKAILVESSRYPDHSYHIWALALHEIPAYVLRAYGQRILEKCNLTGKVELFPKQNIIPKNGFGNGLKLPLGYHRKAKKWSCFLNPKTFEPLPMETILNVEGFSVSEHEIADIKERMEQKRPQYWFGGESKKGEPYKGEDPPCIKGILQGVKKGQRNDSAMRLVCYWLNFRKNESHQALTWLIEWNRKNSPPLKEDELAPRITSALRQPYNYGCNDPILKNHCKKDGCKLRQKEFVESTLTDALDAERVGEYVKVRCQVVGKGKAQGTQRNVIVENGGQRAEIQLDVIKNWRSLNSAFFGSSMGKIPSVKTYLRSLYAGIWGCEGKDIKIKRSPEEMNYSRLFVQDYVQLFDIDKAYDVEVEDIFLIGKRPEELIGSIVPVEIKGVIAKRKRDYITIFVYNVTPLEIHKCTSHEGFDKWFRTNSNLIQDLDMTIANEIKGREKAKLAAALVLHSPLFINFEGTIDRGYLIIMLLGDTKLGKSRILRLIAKLLGIGQYATGDTCKRTGLLYKHEQRANIWRNFLGLLPQNDRGLLLLDSFQKLSQEDIQQMREALDEGILRIYGAAAAIAPMRTRLITASNPFETTMEDYRYACLAIKDVKGLRDPRDITRFDLFIPFREGDVEKTVIADAKREPSTIPLDVLRNHVFWVWNLKPEQIVFGEETMKEIRSQFLKFQEMAGGHTAGLPLVHSGYKKLIARFSASFACLRHNVDEQGNVVVLPSHVGEACDLINWSLRKLDFPEYSDMKRAEREITTEQWIELDQLLVGAMYDALKEIGDHPTVKRGVLAERLGVEPRSATRYLDKLEAYNLVEKAKPSGWKTTARGNKVLRIKEQAQVAAIKKGKGFLSHSIKDALLSHPQITSDSGVTIDDLISWTAQQTGSTKDDIYKVIEMLEKEGKLFRPQPTKLKKA